jgi:hypothetical protein
VSPTQTNLLQSTLDLLKWKKVVLAMASDLKAT